MDIPSLLSIECELPRDEVVISKLPPNLGSMPDASGNLSYDYYNILELENVVTRNKAEETQTVDFSLCHVFKKSDYPNNIIDVTSTDISLAPSPGEAVEKVRWIDMTIYQLVTMINEEYLPLTGKNLLTINEDDTITLSLPSGMSIYFCHSLIWKALGLYDTIVNSLVKYTHPTDAEKRKFTQALRRTLIGLQNKSSFQNLDVVSDYLDLYDRVSDLFPIISHNIENDNDVTKCVRFYAIITFAKTSTFYTERFNKRFPLQLIPLNQKFITTLKNTILEYSNIILDRKVNDPLYRRFLKTVLI